MPFQRTRFMYNLSHSLGVIKLGFLQEKVYMSEQRGARTSPCTVHVTGNPRARETREEGRKIPAGFLIKEP